jgi:hypothetical protein
MEELSSSTPGNENQGQSPQGLGSSLEERRRALRARVSRRSLSPAELQMSDEIRWALEDPEVLARYCGQFVVPWGRTIVAHGDVAAVVLDEAARLTGKKPEELPLVPIVDPLLDIPH